MSLRNHLVAGARGLLRQFDARLVRDRAMRDPVRLTILKSRELGVETVLDVGANVGQFGLELLEAGWKGGLVSFEPISENHAGLRANAARRSGWVVPPAMALGSAEAMTEINIAQNSTASSLLPVGSASTDVLDETKYVGVEKIQVCRLDDIVSPEWKAPFAIKTDTQGFDLEVLRGAPETLSRTKVLMIEMIMAPLYEGGARFGELYTFIEDAGFRCIALTEGFADYDRNEVLQVDGVFVRDR